jgi:hypothetical protein
LKKIANSNSSTDEDSKVIEYLLRTSGLPNARVVLGVVYPYGHGHPMSIHTAAKAILEASQKKLKKAGVD